MGLVFVLFISCPDNAKAAWSTTHVAFSSLAFLVFVAEFLNNGTTLNVVFGDRYCPIVSNNAKPVVAEKVIWHFRSGLSYVTAQILNTSKHMSNNIFGMSWAGSLKAHSIGKGPYGTFIFPIWHFYSVEIKFSAFQIGFEHIAWNACLRVTWKNGKSEEADCDFFFLMAIY